MRASSAFILLVLLALPAAGLEPYLVKDINPLPSPDSSNPSALVSFQGAAFFAADDGSPGIGLWRSDGTEAGTWRVADTCAPGCGGPVPFAVTPGLYFFLGNTTRTTLWVTAGGPASTFQLTGAYVAAVEPLWVPSQRVLYFVASEAAHGEELWRTDGTAAGTHPVVDLRPGPDGSGVKSLAALGGKVYFGAADGLWRTDGTDRGTARVKALGSPALLKVLGNRLFFSASTPARGTELWRSDGTDKGTAMVVDIAPGKASAEPRDFTAVGQRLFFRARNAAGLHLWVTDGTAAGTRSLTQPAGATAQAPLLPAVIGGRLLFLADHRATGRELWSTDGTSKGTRLVRDVCPGSCWGVNSGMFSVHQGRLFFPGITPAAGTEPWVTDGTAAGTRLIGNLCPGSCSSWPSHAVPFKSWLLFATAVDAKTQALWRTDGRSAVRIGTAANGFFPAQAGGALLFAGTDPQHGVELFRTDGTSQRTGIVKDVNDLDLGGAGLNILGAVGDRVLFYAQDGERGHELWKSDGTEAGTALVHERIPGEEPRGAILYTEHAEAAGGRLFFFRRVGETLTLWVSDGTAAGTLQLTDRPVCCQLRVAGGKAFFLGDDGVHGGELWVSDGTVAGTRMVEDILPGRSGYQLFDFTPFQGHLYFLALFGSDLQLWRSDGTEAGTLPFNDLLAQDLSDVEYPTVHEGRLWLVAGDELWSTDGTASGTRLELEVLPGPQSVHVGELVFVDGKLFFPVEAYGSAAGEYSGLWVSDLTAAGTRRVSPVQMKKPLGGFQGDFYFVATGGAHFDLAWRSDGTEAGTAPLLDQDGQEIHNPAEAVVLGERLLLSTAESGYSLWETDGTQAGTVRLRSLATNGTSGAWKLFKAGSRVFFGSYDPATGHELWAVEAGSP